MERTIEGHDVYGDPWSAALPADGEYTNGACVRLDFFVDGDEAAVMPDERSAARLGAFLLSAAGVKLVETAQAALGAIEAHDHKRMTAAGDALAAELAKLDALTGDK